VPAFLRVGIDIPDLGHRHTERERPRFPYQRGDQREPLSPRFEARPPLPAGAGIETRHNNRSPQRSQRDANSGAMVAQSLKRETRLTVSGSRLAANREPETVARARDGQGKLARPPGELALAVHPVKIIAFISPILSSFLSQKPTSFCDKMAKQDSSQSIDEAILKSVRATKSAFTFSAKDFSRLGSSDAIRKALERLTKQNLLRRVRRGFYDRPRPHPLLGQTAPDPMDLVRQMMKNSSAQWQASGAYAANLLHLSEQVPSKIVILTDGVPRKIRLEKLMIEFRRAAPRYLLGGGGPAGLVFQALRYLGPKGITPEITTRLRRQLTPQDKADLDSIAMSTPAWMRPILREISEPV